MRFRILLLTTLVALSLLSPLPGALFVSAKTPTQERTPARRTPRKMSDELQTRADRARDDSRETARVILRVADGQTTDDTASLARRAGARVSDRLDSLGFVVADVPVSKLSALAARDEVSWVTEDRPVRSTAASYDNTSHHEVTTGASKVLPVGNNALADGGGGYKIGIAILDSGISPPDAAEFAGYEWRYSSGTLGTGLFAQKYLASYPRVLAHVDFTGEGKTDDAYGHGTHTAGVAAGTGQSSEDYAAQNAGSPTFGGIATNANLVDLRVLDSYGVGQVSNVIKAVNWAIQNKKTYNIRVMNLSLGASPSQSYKTDPLCQAVAKAVDAGIVVVVAGAAPILIWAAFARIPQVPSMADADNRALPAVA